MKRKFDKPLVLLSFILGFQTASAFAAGPQACHGNNCVSLEVVSKPHDLERGLMDRPQLPAEGGMLFVFSADDKYAFWMKNMRINLDMAWIDKDGRIVDIGHDVLACKGDPCPIYVPKTPARYVLEINSGYTASHGWKEGDKLTLIDIPEK